MFLLIFYGSSIMASIVFGCPPNTACRENPNPFCHFRKEGDTIRKRNKTITVRCTEEEKARILSKAESYGLPLSDYVLRSAAEKKIVVAEGLSEVIKQQKAISNNLNQLAMLCNMGRIEAPGLDELIRLHTTATNALCTIAKAVK